MKIEDGEKKKAKSKIRLVPFHSEKIKLPLKLRTSVRPWKWSFQQTRQMVRAGRQGEEFFTLLFPGVLQPQLLTYENMLFTWQCTTAKWESRSAIYPELAIARAFGRVSDVHRWKKKFNNEKKEKVQYVLKGSLWPWEIGSGQAIHRET